MRLPFVFAVFAPLARGVARPSIIGAGQPESLQSGPPAGRFQANLTSAVPDCGTVTSRVCSWPL